MRFFIELSYDGTNYHGWQEQPNNRTIQGEINNGLSTLLKTKITTIGASRTDTGVHARKMYAHFDHQNRFDISKIIYNLNGFLDKDIAIHNIFKVDNTSNCRFDAINRTYNYYVIQSKNPFNNTAHLVYKNLDINAMNIASKDLLGIQDFTSFSKLNTQTFTNNCEVIIANWIRNEGQLIFTIKANRFLHSMVRSIVGTLINVGEGKIPVDNIKKIILKRDRSAAGVAVPAKALFLDNIEYPRGIFNER